MRHYSFVTVDGWYGTASWCVEVDDVIDHTPALHCSWIYMHGCVESAPLIHLCRGRSNSDMKWIAPLNRLHVHQWPSHMLRGRHFFALSCICVDDPAAIHNVRLFIDNTSDFVCSDASSSSGEAVDDDLSKDSSRRHCRCWRWDRWRRLVGRMRSRYGVARGPTFRLGPQSGME